MSLLRVALESEDKPLAIIVKGNPKYLSDPKVKPLADAFYKEVKDILKEQGFRVKFDAGADYTRPDMDASVWVGHSRGIGRLQYASASIKTVALETKHDIRPNKSYTQKEKDEIGHNKGHYELSAGDIRHLKNLRP